MCRTSCLFASNILDDGIRAKYGCKEHSPQLDVGVSRRRCDEGTCGSRAAYSAVSAVRWSGVRRDRVARGKGATVYGGNGGWVCSACLARRSSAEASCQDLPRVSRCCFLSWPLARWAQHFPAKRLTLLHDEGPLPTAPSFVYAHRITTVVASSGRRACHCTGHDASRTRSGAR